MDAPIGQVARWKEGWKRVLVVVNGCQEVQAPAVVLNYIALEAIFPIVTNHVNKVSI